ncbi:MAG: peptide chain release factor N(5)-glutamine methyltransferase [Alphaproteobacteria bacterium]|nr:peptide chain release factor N(5)-glutamine methyltransferase [Alphaproteobacteria bacterium]MBL6936435.1 peptide chain release factor N(5)-glutamine methyltransferase [Alphaproteobacteria bacterium]MBL7098514.1 peptide chain release factor N(5)-glutamine methyltransferase [Alphaproteobacteria bacterium]
MSDPVAGGAQRLRDAGVDNPRLDARLLWEHAQRIQRSALVAYDRRDHIFNKLIARRAAREPLAYITGHKEFWSLDFEVGTGCLIPRPDTETLIEELRRIVPGKAAPLSILDLGTGSGCILIAALSECPNAHGVGIDSSSEALGWAARNVRAHRLEDRASLIQTAWLEEASPGFDVVLSNPPYVASGDIATLEPEVRDHEPRAALDGGPDGLDAYRALSTRIGPLLRPGGHALLEIGSCQASAVIALMAAGNLEVLRTVKDLAQIPRAIVARRNQ